MLVLVPKASIRQTHALEHRQEHVAQRRVVLGVVGDVLAVGDPGEAAVAWSEAAPRGSPPAGLMPVGR